MELNKRAVVFTGTALVICGVLITAFYAGSQLPVDTHVPAVERRVEQTNDILDNLPTFTGVHMKRAFEGGLREVIIATEDTDGLYTNFTETMNDCMLNGSFEAPNAGPTVTCRDIYQELNYLEEFIKNNTNTDIDINVTRIDFAQSTPFLIELSGNFTATAEDFAAQYNYTASANATLPVQGLPDPVYLFSENTTAPARYYNTSINFARNFSEWDNNTPQNVVVNKQYFTYSGAPSFLSRLEGSISADPCCGVASIVIPDVHDDIGENISHLDYDYWNEEECNGDLKRINFWAPTSSSTLRAQYNITASGYGLNGSILPEAFLNASGLDDNRYIEDVTSC